MPPHRPHLVVAILALSFAGVLVAPSNAGAVPTPSGFTQTVVASGLTQPTSIAFAPDGRVFIAQQTGSLLVMKNGSVLSAPFVQLPVDAVGERGLLGVTLDPAFATNHFLYVYYTATTPTTHNRVSRFTDLNDRAAPGSEVHVLDLPTLGATNHNGGSIHFGPDGKLYIGVGENAVPSRAQDLTTPFGKLLRINADGSVPTDNPFVSTPGAEPRVWALGLRNPFSFAFEPGTGRLFINDVGQDLYEEIDVGQAGANYGWPITEGPTSDPRFVSPLFAYKHNVGCAITGGTFYRPPIVQFPAQYVGDYFFIDLCGGWIHRLDAPGYGFDAFTGADASQPVGLETGPDGALWFLTRANGALNRLAAKPAVGVPGWYLRNANTTGVADIQFTYGNVGDQVLACDWNGDGIDTPAVVRNGVWYERNTTTGGVADTTFGYGNIGDTPICGDWNGDGIDTPGLTRNGVFYLRNTNSTGVADLTFGYGNTGDTAIVGDWNRDGIATIGVHRGATFYLRNTNSTGVADLTFAFGASSAVPVAGDWNADGTDTIGVWTGGAFQLRNSNTAGPADVAFSYGATTDLPVPGDWNGNGTVTAGVVRMQ
jgi:glucose/arabinose dehydrogenase